MPSWARKSVASEGRKAQLLRPVRAEQQPREQVGGDRGEAEAADDETEDAEQTDRESELSKRHLLWLRLRPCAIPSAPPPGPLIVARKTPAKTS